MTLCAYAPLLAFGSGNINADTKLYLYSDPAGLMDRALRAWDPSQFGGYVPHQGVGYLWPMGPWYRGAELLGIPDWLAQRLWLGTVFLLAALGVRRLLTHLSFTPAAALLGGLSYMFSPYVLPYQARTSAMLLPWAGLGWLCWIAARGVVSRSWRWPAAAALVLASVAQVNGAATVFMLAGPAVVVLEGFLRGTRRGSLVFVLRAGILGAAVSTWWIVAVVLQARHGADVLAYSETLEAVSSTSNAVEVMRGFGYWLTYVGLDSIPLTTAALGALSSPVSVIASLMLPTVAIAVLGRTRRTEARLGIGLVVVGLVLAVGAHPIDGPSPLFDAVLSRPDSTLALALRSSTRAVPVMLIGLAIGLALLVDSPMWARLATGRVGPRLRAVLGPSTGVALVVSLLVAAPDRILQGSVDPNLGFAAIPDSWRSAASDIEEATAEGARILQVPGQEFGSYTWGHTNDPALPAVTARPVLTRDLLPLGNAQMMDALLALDDAVREGRLDAASLIALGGTLSYGAVFLPGDTRPERYGTPSADDIMAANALAASLVDLGDGHRALLLPRGTGVAVRQQEATLVVAGDGKGLIDTAAAGLLGGGTVRYVADIPDDALAAELRRARGLVVTDTAALVARQWRGSRDAVGYPEDVAGRLAAMVRDRADVRLPVFTRAVAPDRTSFEQEGPVRVRASGYGSPLGYQPEHRPFRAVDGDESTAWRVGSGVDPRGAVFEITATDPFSSLRLLQPPGDRRITRLSVSTDGGPWRERSLFTGDTILDLDAPTTVLAMRIDSVDGDTASGDGVGFAEVDLGRGPVREVGIMPTRGADQVEEDTPVAWVMTRLRAPVHQTSRADPETSFVRRFDAPWTRPVVIHADVHADDGVASPVDVTVDLDGVTIPLRRDATIGGWVSEPLVLAAGTHEVSTHSSGVVLDRVVVTDTAWTSTAFAATPVASTGDATRRTARTDPCPRGCWLVLAEGHSDRWRATLDGRDLGESLPVDGGANGWWLEPGTSAATVTFDFLPQRTLTRALWATVLAVVVAAAILVATRRRTAEPVTPLAAPRPRRWPALVAPLAGLATVVLVSPRYGVLAALVVAVLPRLPERVADAVGPGLLAAGLSWGGLLLITSAVPPGFDWPEAAEPAHRLVLLGAMVTTFTVFATRRTDGSESIEAGRETTGPLH